MVECGHCGVIYDLGDGEPIARYADCDVFTTPCCGRQVDSRQWKTIPDYTPVSSGDLRALVQDGEAVRVFKDGRIKPLRVEPHLAARIRGGRKAW
jgi:hypothetical protein